MTQVFSLIRPPGRPDWIRSNSPPTASSCELTTLSTAALVVARQVLQNFGGGNRDVIYTIWCIVVYKMMKEKAVRQSVSLPPRLAKQVGNMAKSRKLSKNRMLLELIENGIDAEVRKQRQFFALAERFRNEKDPEAANRLGDELGKMVFGG